MSTEVESISSRLIELAIPRRKLYQDNGDLPFLEALLKGTPASLMTAGASQQGVTIGRKQHPFDMDRLASFRLENSHHSTCLNAKVSSTVGLGFKNTKVSEILDPLCRESWLHTITQVAEDYYEKGNGYLEVVHSDEGNVSRITGLHHVPAPEVAVVVDDAVTYDMHFELLAREATRLTRFAEFGDLENFMRRLSLGTVQMGVTSQYNLRPSEIIHFKRATSLSRWYGFPDYVAALAAVQLVQALHQHNYDFFTNRGVPEFMLFLLGKKLSPEDWDKVEKALKAHVGLGNSHKSLALNIQDPEMKIQLEKLAIEGKSDAAMYVPMAEALSLEIVSAHRVPPLLAGIVIPGRIGSANELPNALMAFQILVIGPAQMAFESMLNNTLGNAAFNGGLGLTRGDFELKKITEEMNLNMMSTIGGMRQPLPEAQAQGRDLSAGFKKEEAAGALVSEFLKVAFERFTEQARKAA